MTPLRPYQLAAIAAVRGRFQDAMSESKEPARTTRPEQMLPITKRFIVQLKISTGIDEEKLLAWMGENRKQLAIGYLAALGDDKMLNVGSFLDYARVQYARSLGKAI